MSCPITHTHTNTTENTCAIPSRPKPTTNTQLPKEYDQFTAAPPVSAALLSYALLTLHPQLLGEACWERHHFHQKALDRQLLFKQKIIHHVGSSAHTQTNRVKVSALTWTRAPDHLLPPSAGPVAQALPTPFATRYTGHELQRSFCTN